MRLGVAKIRQSPKLHFNPHSICLDSILVFFRDAILV